MKHGNIALTEC